MCIVTQSSMTSAGSNAGPPGTDHPVCGMCEQRESTISCDQCAETFCGDCNSLIHRGQMAFHRIGPIGETPLQYCPLHLNELLDFHCEHCETIVCGRCLLLGVHRGHSCCPLDEWYLESVQTTKGEARTIDDERVHVEELCAALRPVIPAMEASHAALEQQINEEMEHLRAAVRAREDCIMEQIDEVCHQRQRAVDCQSKELDLEIETMTKIFDRVQDALEIEDEEQFLLNVSHFSTCLDN